MHEDSLIPQAPALRRKMNLDLNFRQFVLLPAAWIQPAIPINEEAAAVSASMEIKRLAQAKVIRQALSGYQTFDVNALCPSRLVQIGTHETREAWPTAEVREWKLLE
jgi:hypothetical protein